MTNSPTFAKQLRLVKSFTGLTAVTSRSRIDFGE